jgi:hypothetical protein
MTWTDRRRRAGARLHRDNGRYQPRPKAVGCMPWFGAWLPPHL